MNAVKQIKSYNCFVMISVIIPAFNAEKYLSQAIESILDQEYDGEIEIIAIDDGSTDGTANVILSYPDIRYVYQSNSGEASARNAGLALARGKYIAWLDADDWYEKGKLEKQRDFLDQHPEYGFVYCDFRTYDEISMQYSVLHAESFVEGRENFLARILFRQIIPGIAGIMFRRECIDEGCGYDPELKFAPDYGFCLQLLLKGFSPGYIPEPLYGYRRHQGNVTNHHQLQRNSETNQVKSLGIEKIKQIISSTSFSDDEKRVLLARILLKIGNIDYCLEVLEQSNDEIALPMFYRGNCYYLLGEFQSAMDCYRNCLKNPTRGSRFHYVETGVKTNQLSKLDISPEIFNNLGCCYVQKNDLEKASECFSRACSLRGDYMDPSSNIQLIQLYTTDRLSKDKLQLTRFELRRQLLNYSMHREDDGGGE